jgi:type IV secretory pathway VirB10-like protein
MSRSTFQRKAGLIFALAAFVLGVTAATALGWANEKNEKGKEHGKKKEAPPTVTVPTPSPQVTPPPPAPAPPAAAPAPAPVAPTQAPPQQVGAQGAPEQQQGGGEQEARQRGAPSAPAEAAPAAQTVALAPAVERKQLARTGLDPVLMALLGAFCLAGGGLLFRRAMAR